MKHIYSLLFACLATSLVWAQIDLTHISSFETGVFDEGAAEIVAYDTTHQQLVFTNSNDNELEIVDFSDPANPTAVTAIDLSTYGGGVNSVKVFGNGIYAVAVEADVKQDSGSVVFFDHTGQFLSAVQVGALPDMIAVSKDGSFLMTANEGEPNDDWTRDPEGSISWIDVSNGVAAASVVHLDFNSVTIAPDVNIYGPMDAEVWYEDFQDEDTVNFDTVFNRWMVYNEVGGSRTWGEYEFPSGSAQLYARISGFDGGCQDQEDYLVSDKIYISEDFQSVELEFSSAYNFSGPEPNLWVATDYMSGMSPVMSGTWDDLSGQVNWPSVDGYTWESSGMIDLSAYRGDSIAIAFRYTANTSDCRTVQVDSIRISGMYGASNNLEPEYVAISDDGNNAFAVLQENNALAVMDLSIPAITDVISLGYKDHSQPGNGLDPSDRDSGIRIAEHPVFGMYQPDAMTFIEIDGQGYLITANEGDARDYDAYSEEERIKDITLDPTVFPNAVELQEDSVLGRLNITTSLGDTDGDGDFDELYSYGARSFTIWNADNGNVVWDSGDELEQRTAAAFPDDFNSNNDENDSFESRSDNKGPEPEAVTTAMFNGEPHALVGLERIGGVMVYNISDPSSPQFISYVNNRDFSVDAQLGNGDINPAVGDLGVEDVIVIDGAVSPDGKTYAVTSNEVSGTVSIFEVTGLSTSVNDRPTNGIALVAYPNPANQNTVTLNKVGQYTVVDLNGRILISANNTSTLDVSNLAEGVYFIQSAEGELLKLIKN